ncbi:hypothetical protein MYX07_02075 [Patescibacteria group bacterium AH-259-L07]|nr:hypothetical protein [Patescibacteria group bacterium AH-259-L07]
MENSTFLKKKYGLHTAPEVASAARRTEERTGKKLSQKPEVRIQNYLNRFKEIIERTDPQERERGIQALKKVLLHTFVTRFEDIPESYWEHQERILRERGQQGDYDSFSEEEKRTWKKQLVERLLDDQRASLEQWIDDFASPGSSYMPDYMKYWVFRSVVNLQEYDKDKKKFPKRSKGTLKMFPDINHEALTYLIDKIIKKYHGKPVQFEDLEYELTTEEKEIFKQHLTNENFAKLYAWAHERIHPIPKHLLPLTEGQWVKHDQGPDHLPLAKSIRGRGTGWCTAGENTAQTQLKGGDFHVFYSHDDEGEPTIPRIAIRMEDNKIAEIRGIAENQNLDPYMNEVLAQKLEAFPDKDRYFKKEHDMKLLTKIEHKMEAGHDLDKDELIYLYEISTTIQGFGYKKDPRIQKLRDQRELKQDYTVMFDCSPEQVATSPDQLDNNTVVYTGGLYPNILSKWKRLPTKLQYIGRDAEFGDSPITDLGQLQYIGGSAYFGDSPITDLGQLQHIGGGVSFRDSHITDLGQLQTIGGYADFRRSQVENLGQLQHIGEDASFENSQITDLGQLQTIGGSAYFGDSPITDLGQLQTIGWYADFRASHITDFGQLQTIGWDADFRDSHITDLGQLQRIGRYIHIDETSSHLDFSQIKHGEIIKA